MNEYSIKKTHTHTYTPIHRNTHVHTYIGMYAYVYKCCNYFIWYTLPPPHTHTYIYIYIYIYWYNSQESAQLLSWLDISIYYDASYSLSKVYKYASNIKMYLSLYNLTNHNTCGCGLISLQVWSAHNWADARPLIHIL